MESTKNLKNLNDIDNYINTHGTDFKQVFFKPTVNNIKSERVGVYIKDIYNRDMVTPIKEVPGLHTADSCKLNTALYANSKIDYNSSLKYKPGLKYTTVVGDFAGSANYFLTATVIKDEKTTPENYIQYNTSDVVSVEIVGYIASRSSGNYKVLTQDKPLKNVLLWIGNNALKTYRKENANYNIENYVIKTNNAAKVMIGEYVPFRMQYSYTNVGLSVLNLLFNEDKVPISVFATNDNENKLYYYSLTPDKDSYYKCNIYSGTDLKINNNDATLQIVMIWSMDIPDDTAYVCVDMIGNLCTYNSKNEKTKIIFQVQDPANQNNQTVAGKYDLILDESVSKPFYIKNEKSVIFPITTTDIPAGSVPNEKLRSGSQLKKSPMTNKTQQVDDKQISIDKITEDNPLFSENFLFKVAIITGADGKKMIGLLTSVQDNRVFYTAESDMKMNKLFYASTFVENQFLKEVPESLKSYDQTNPKYSNYPNTFPESGRGYDITDCKTDCLSCDHFYKVSDSTGTKCLVPSTNDPITFLPKQPDSPYETSELIVKNSVIKTNNEDKDKIYGSAKYISNGYEYGVASGFSSYPVEKNTLSKEDTPGPEGTSYVSKLKNHVEQSTTGTQKKYNPIVNNPMFAGKLENFESVNDNSLKTINTINSNYANYIASQKQIDPNRNKIGNQITSINTLYTDMSNNNIKYDFTSKDAQQTPVIYSLDEDRSLTSALIKDNAIYLAEQNNLYLIGTLTMATLLISAILISK